MKVIAKMQCRAANAQQRIFNDEHVVGGDIELHCVYENTENPSHAAFANATPYGELKMSIDNPSAFSQFVPGKVYLVTLEVDPEGESE